MIGIFSFLLIFLVDISRGADCGIDGKDCLCGTTNPDRVKYYDGINHFYVRAKRSVGARKSKEGNWPWLTNVVFGNKTCTGVILSPNWILTSNCLEKTTYNSSTGFVQYGSPELSKTLKVGVKEVTPHPEFKISTEIYKINNIALVKVSETIEFNSTLHGICVKKNLNHKRKEIAVFAGYGGKFYRVLDYNRTNDPEPLKDHEIYSGEPDVLRETPVILQPNNICGIPSEGQKVLVCTANSAHGPTAGDEGGPLMLVRQDKFILYGIASSYTNFSFGGDVLAVLNSATYTQVSNYCEWIEKVTEGEFVCDNSVE
ncbi:hypothetical protein FO519_001378 [Halicephalobus sp. NKZ332]|nr:hypothetical protein FO519_001378 [Halicephalobus sp. NKZ332]